MQCSASLINPKLVITAAHCVALGGKWHSGIVFVPAFKDGSMPYGYYGVRDAWVFQSWFYGQNTARDVAVIFLHDPVGDRIGYLGVTADIGPNQTWSQIDYPGETGFRGEPFDGMDQVWSRSGFGHYNVYTGSPPQLTAGSCLTRGSSGGPWVLWESMQVNGVVSLVLIYGCPFSFSTPYFDASVGEMMLQARDAQ